jgi:hypothetical protein
MDTFCALPWKHLDIGRNGRVRVCCLFEGDIPAADGSPSSVMTQTVEEIWNCEFMRDIRRDMVEGKRVAGCSQCYQLDDVGGESYRKYVNRSLTGENPEKIEQLKEIAAADNYWLSTFPSYLVLNGGTACNLKCRMCYGGNSSRIELDPVHNRWRYGEMPPPEDRWYDNEEIIRNHILLFPEQLEAIEIVGGETFLLKEIGVILQYLIDMGVAQNIQFCATTNGTVPIPRWFDLTAHFASTALKKTMSTFASRRNGRHWTETCAVSRPTPMSR